MDFFGLDIGSQNLKLVQLKKSGDQFTVAALGLAPTPKSLESEAEADQIKVAEAIKQLLKATRVSVRNVVSALPEDKIFTRIIEFPQMAEKELESAIRWEAEQYVPIPLEEAIVDYQFIKGSPKVTAGDKKKVFLVAAPRLLVNKYTSILEMAGLKPLALETEMVALSRSLILPGATATIIVDLGARATDIAFVEKNQIVLTRSIASAGAAITRALATSLGLKSSQAEAYKKAYGVDGTRLEGKIRDALGPILDLVIKEIKNAISFYQENNRESKIERIILTGGTADLPQIVPLFAKNLGIEVEVGDPFLRVINAQEIMKKIEKGTTSLYSIAFGLAMKKIGGL